jgi:hypothetical protein
MKRIRRRQRERDGAKKSQQRRFNGLKMQKKISEPPGKSLLHLLLISSVDGRRKFMNWQFFDEHETPESQVQLAKTKNYQRRERCGKHFRITVTFVERWQPLPGHFSFEFTHP